MEERAEGVAGMVVVDDVEVKVVTWKSEVKKKRKENEVEEGRMKEPEIWKEWEWT